MPSRVMVRILGDVAIHQTMSVTMIFKALLELNRNYVLHWNLSEDFYITASPPAHLLQRLHHPVQMFRLVICRDKVCNSH
jgi:hypothetical protein